MFALRSISVFRRLGVLAAVAAIALPGTAPGQGMNGPPVFYEGPVATIPSRGATEILREAERQPRLGERFDLPALSGPVDIQLPPAFRDSSSIAPPVSARPQSAERYGGR